MKHFTIKKKFTAQNILILLYQNTYVIKFVFFISLSLVILALETWDSGYFDGIKSKILNSQITQAISLPAKGVNQIISAVQNLFLSESIEQGNAISAFEFKKLQRDNERLKELLNFVEGDNFEVITAPIVWAINNNFAHYGIINVGSSMGIKKGQAVISQNRLIGKILHTSENMARILFVYDSNFRISSKVVKSGTEVIVTGRNNKSRLGIMHVSEDVKLDNDDYLVTAGDFPNLPPGVLLGRFRKPNLVEIDINWSRLDFVGVIISNKE